MWPTRDVAQPPARRAKDLARFACFSAVSGCLPVPPPRCRSVTHPRGVRLCQSLSLLPMAFNGQQAGAGAPNATWAPHSMFPPQLGASRPQATLNPANLNDLLLLEHTALPRCAAPPHKPPAWTRVMSRRRVSGGPGGGSARLVALTQRAVVGSAILPPSPPPPPQPQRGSSSLCMATRPPVPLRLRGALGTSAARPGAAVPTRQSPPSKGSGLTVADRPHPLTRPLCRPQAPVGHRRALSESHAFDIAAAHVFLGVPLPPHAQGCAAPVCLRRDAPL